MEVEKNMNAYVLYDWKTKDGTLKGLIESNLFNELIVACPDLVYDSIKKDPSEIELIDTSILESHPDIVVTAINLGLSDISWLSKRMLRRKVVKEAILKRIFEDYATLPFCKGGVPDYFFSTYLSDIYNNLEKSCHPSDIVITFPEKYFKSPFWKYVKDAIINDYPSFCSDISDDFWLQNESLFLSVISAYNIKYFSSLVLSYYALKLPISILGNSQYYKYNKGTFAIMLRERHDEVIDFIKKKGRNYWFYFSSLDYMDITDDQVIELYSIFESQHGFDFDNEYYEFYCSYFNRIDSIPSVMNSIMIHSYEVLTNFGTKITDIDTIKKIIKMNPSYIVYLNPKILMGIELNSEDFSSDKVDAEISSDKVNAESNFMDLYFFGKER